MTEKILETLRTMDPLDDEQWTSDGMPRMDYVQGEVGDDSITRAQIVDAAPDFNRKTAEKPEDLLMNQPEENNDDNPDGNDEGSDGEGNSEEAGNTSEAGEPEVTEDEPEVSGEDIDFDNFNPVLFKSYLSQLDEFEVEEFQKELTDAMDRADSEIEGLNKLKLHMTSACELVALRLKEINPNSSDASAIRSFIQSQHEARAARIGKRNEILKGIKADELDPRAQIDRAMSRNTTRGGKRPQRPMMNR